MKLKIKDLDIATGGPLVAILSKKDAEKLDLHEMDRIKIIKGRKVETVVVDIAQTQKTVKPGELAIFDEVVSSLKLKNNDSVKIVPARKPLSIDYIRKKLDGYKLTKKEINQIVWDITHNKLSQIELTYFVAACYTNLMTMDETIMLTKAIVKHGDILKINNYPRIDKHCIGGLAGNRTTMILVPIIAAAGYTMAKTSSRSITSPAGTADTMEILSNVSFPIKKMKKIIEKTKGCIVWGGALNLAPADDKIIFVEKPLGIDAESQLLASIMAKKHSVSSTHILIDIPVGKDAKVKNRKEAHKLKKDFEEVGKRLKKKVKVMITDGSKPIGKGIGPALEARDVLWVLKRDSRRPVDLERKCIMMAAEIFNLIGIKNGRKKAIELLEKGDAYCKMIEIIKAQKKRIIDPDKIKLGKYKCHIRASKTGYIKEINNSIVIRIARIAGAPKNPGSGIYLHRNVKDYVEKNEKLFTIYAESRQKLDYAIDIIKDENPYIINGKI